MVVADDAGDQVGTIGECDEENNRHDTGLFLNQPPTVDAGPDRTTSLPNATLLLSAAVEDDGLPLGAGLSVRWFYAGPLDPSHGAAALLRPHLADDDVPRSLSPEPTGSGSTSRTRASRATDFLEVTVTPRTRRPS